MKTNRRSWFKALTGVLVGAKVVRSAPRAETSGNGAQPVAYETYSWNNQNFGSRVARFEVKPGVTYGYDIIDVTSCDDRFRKYLPEPMYMVTYAPDGTERKTYLDELSKCPARTK